MSYAETPSKGCKATSRLEIWDRCRSTRIICLNHFLPRGSLWFSRVLRPQCDPARGDSPLPLIQAHCEQYGSGSLRSGKSADFMIQHSWRRDPAWSHEGWWEWVALRAELSQEGSRKGKRGNTRGIGFSVRIPSTNSHRREHAVLAQSGT